MSKHLTGSGHPMRSSLPPSRMKKGKIVSAEEAVQDGRLEILREGKVRKFLAQVEHVTFSGSYAVKKGPPVMYITERCVFRLTPEGMTLVEIAPGIDLEWDVLAHMAFMPIMKTPPRLMDSRIFQLEPTGLKEDMITISLEDRMTCDPAENIIFINFENYSVKNSDQVRDIEAMVETIVRPLGKKVYAIVNYDNFTIAPEVLNEYTYMVKGLVDRFYTSVNRYTASTFLRMKLGGALEQRNVSPHIHEGKADAQKALGISSKVETA